MCGNLLLRNIVIISDIFLPCPDNLLVNLQESKELVIDLLNQLPSMFENNMETGSALGAALQAAYKMMVSTLQYIPMGASFICYGTIYI